MNDNYIDKILNAKKPSDIFTDDWKKEYIQYSKYIHPDTCKHPNANNAMSKLNEFKDLLNNGIAYTDESGDFRLFEKRIEYIITDSNRDLIMKSYNNYMLIKSIKHKSLSDHFYKYLPKSMEISGNKLTIHLFERSLPLTHMTLPQVHVNWIFSRMFEFNLWLNQQGYVHLGYNPTSLYVVPETINGKLTVIEPIYLGDYFDMSTITSKSDKGIGY